MDYYTRRKRFNMDYHTKHIIGQIGVVVILAATIIYILLANYNDNISSQPKTTIVISVFDEENKNIYKETIETDKEYLADVLKDIKKLKVVTEHAQYGDYITSIMGVKQGNGLYWSYYIEDKYSKEGISTCKIEEGTTYKFKIESFH